MSQKSKDDRVRESITILKKMIELGVSKDDCAFIELKTRMTEWINNGLAWTGKISFPSVGRLAVIFLPSKSCRTASIDFKVVSI